MTTEREEIELHPAVGELIVKMRAELADARVTIDRLLGVIGSHGGEVARLEFALQCEATRHEETRAAVREHLAAEAACDDARTALGEMSLIHDTPDAIRAADEAVTAAALRLISARKALRKIVEGE